MKDITVDINSTYTGVLKLGCWDVDDSNTDL